MRYSVGRMAGWTGWAVGLAVAGAACGQESQEDLAKQLANPISSLISVPFQYNYDQDIGPDDGGSVHRLNIQPVWPVSLNQDWNLITRTIVPLVDQEDLPVQGQGESGMGDILASQFFSPAALTAGGWTWGVGPVWLLPSASEDALGAEKWGLGPTGVALKQTGPWSYGALVNQVWTLGGDDQRADVNATFIQPFLTYISKTLTTVAINTESTYDWTAEQWSVPLHLSVFQMIAPGGRPMQVGGGVRYWLDSPETGPEGWGARLQVTLLFPK